ncbi:reverse transcriptase domain-containing protein [Tanacetum coccineum]
MKEVQSLNGKLAGLNRFLSKSADKSLPLFKTLEEVISKPDASGRLQKWSVLLGEHNISYRPRTAVKGQILADFLIEKPETDIVLPQSEVNLPEPWILFTDGSSCVDGSGAGLILTNPEGMEFTYALRFEFTATNNEAEYEALLAGLRIAARMGVRNLEANVDSRLVANHVLGEYVAKEDNMVQYLDKTKSLIQGFDRFTIRQVPRGDNKKADALSKIASTSFAHLSKQVLVEILKNKSISEMEISTVIEEQDPTWMTPIVEFINAGTLPHDIKIGGLCKRMPRRIRRTCAVRFELRRYTLNDVRILQTKAMAPVVGPFSRHVLREIHAVHAVSLHRTTFCVAKALRSWTNGLVERANRSLGEGIKAHLDRHKGRWVEELSHVLWAHRTTIKVSTGDTPFSLVYQDGKPYTAEIGMPTIRTAEVNITTNERPSATCNLDILEAERSETSSIRFFEGESEVTKMKGNTTLRSSRVSFRPGTSVIVANDASSRGRTRESWDQTWGKDPTMLTGSTLERSIQAA